METEELELFIHAHGAHPRPETATHGESLRAVLVRVGILTEDTKVGEVFVFVGECEDALGEPEHVVDGQDEHVPVEIDVAVGVLELHRHRHVHCHRCRHVRVGVQYGPETKFHKFSPAATVATITKWARRKFALDPAAAAEYVLQVHGSQEQPRGNEHVGRLASAPVCSVIFDLVKELTPQG